MKNQNFIATLRKKVDKLSTKRASIYHSNNQSEQSEENKMFEDGSGGPLIYAMCFVAFFVIVYLFIFVEYRANIYTLKDDMETNLHIVENYCLTVNQKTDVGDEFERERERAHIITVGANNPSASIDERRKQANEIGKAFSTQFKETFMLDGCVPTGGYLLQMSKSKKDVAKMYIKEVRIYEPTYATGDTYPVYCGNDIHDHTEECKNKPSGVTIPTGFWVKRSISEWYVYALSFDENNGYLGCTVSKQTDAPKLFNGVPAEGATIESKIAANFYQPENFIKTERNVKTVEVCEALDIVYATDDSRQQ